MRLRRNWTAMSDTPRTNKKEQVTIGDSILSHGVVNADFARQLERELAVYEEQEQGLLWAISDLDRQRKSVSDELAAAQAELAKYRDNCTFNCLQQERYTEKEEREMSEKESRKTKWHPTKGWVEK